MDDRCLYKRKKSGTQTQRGRPCEDGVMPSNAKDYRTTGLGGSHGTYTLAECLGRIDPADTSFSDFRSPELQENTFLWFSASKFVLLHYSSPRNSYH